MTIEWNILSLFIFCFPVVYSVFVKAFKRWILHLFFSSSFFFLSFLSSSNTYGNQKLLWKSSIDTHLQVIFFIWFLFFVLLFREFGQKLSEASKNRGGGNWLQESPSRSINLQRFWPICFVTIPFSKLSFYLSLRYVESSSRIKKTFSENPFLLSFSGIIFSDLYCPIS